MKLTKALLFLTLLASFSCTRPANHEKIENLKDEVASLDSTKNELLKKNKQLQEKLLEYQADEEEAKQAEKARLEKLRKTSQGLVLDNTVQVITVKTGFDPYHNTDDLFLPAIALMFKNISEKDLSEFIKVKAIFIKNTNGEQLAEDYQYLCTSSRPFLTGTKKQITLQSSVGWYAIQDQDVSVKISIEDAPFKTYKIKNREFRGRI